MKHLSKRRNKYKLYSLSSGERRGNSLNSFFNGGCKGLTSGALFKLGIVQVWIILAEGEHVGDLLKEAPWKGAP